ncbi:unnamed protein product [Ambrosiozyma monospora]|uniref:Unnamed protein product n=1 Tax=Ambrosiozyma monospora TaxID=43982 RepID=A0A9W7DNJ0_AMBMO|nr:unnamed protein product [Ambrosiozyma monospora]
MGTDDVVLFPNNGGEGELLIEDVSLGVISLSNSSNPVMGIGFKALQSVVDYNLDQVEYDSLPYQMANQDIINIPAYSISILTNKTIGNSSITFGAIDSTRFTGDLNVFPIPYPAGRNEPVYISIVLNKITTDDGSELASGAAYAILDTGSSETYFPQDIVNAIGSTYFQHDSTYDIYYSKCSRLLETNINFEFSGVSYSVPMTQFVETADDFFVVDHEQFSGQCILNILTTGDDTFMLGDSFLRSVYMVVDLENGEVGLASSLGIEFDEDNASGNFTEIVDSIPGIQAPGYDSGLDYTQLTVTANTTDSSSSSSSNSNSGVSLNTQKSKKTAKKNGKSHKGKKTSKNGKSKKQSKYRLHHD